MKMFNLFKKKSSNKNAETTTLDQIIGGEICGDAFYDLLKSYASRIDLRLFLEIGSSAGGGSTQAFVDAISNRSDSDHVSVYCFELSKNRFKLLAESYSAYPFIKPYNVSSISTNEFPDVASVTNFYQNVKSSLNAYPIETILQWYWQDVNYIKNTTKKNMVTTFLGVKMFN
jgi:hypothetical protein